MKWTPEARRAATLAFVRAAKDAKNAIASGRIPDCTVAVYNSAAGARVTVSGEATASTLVMACEGCGLIGAPYYPSEYRHVSDLLGTAQYDAERHAKGCRQVPRRLWSENAGGAK